MRNGESRYLTLTAGVVETVTFSQDWAEVEVMVRGGADEVFFTVGSDPAPTVEGDDTYLVLPNGFLAVPDAGSGATTVRLISAGAAAVSVVARRS